MTMMLTAGMVSVIMMQRYEDDGNNDGIDCEDDDDDDNDDGDGNDNGNWEGDDLVIWQL
jgi:hypothetical protein